VLQMSFGSEFQTLGATTLNAHLAVIFRHHNSLLRYGGTDVDKDRYVMRESLYKQ